MTTSHTLLASLGLYFFSSYNVFCSLNILKPHFYTNQTQHTLKVLLLVRHNQIASITYKQKETNRVPQKIIHFIRNNKTERHRKTEGCDDQHTLLDHLPQQLSENKHYYIPHIPES